MEEDAGGRCAGLRGDREKLAREGDRRRGSSDTEQVQRNHDIVGKDRYRLTCRRRVDADHNFVARALYQLMAPVRLHGVRVHRLVSSRVSVW